MVGVKIMEHGFYHPSIGYWQTISYPSDETLSSYPEGTTKVPLKPGAYYDWDGTKWVKGEESPPPVPESISFAQLVIGLVSEQWITVEEGRAWRDRVSLPQAVQTLITSLPVEQQFIAETKALTPSIVLRSDPLTLALAASTGRTEEEIDNFFIKYSQV